MTDDDILSKLGLCPLSRSSDPSSARISSLESSTNLNFSNSIIEGEDGQVLDSTSELKLHLGHFTKLVTQLTAEQEEEVAQINLEREWVANNVP